MNPGPVAEARITAKSPQDKRAAIDRRPFRNQLPYIKERKSLMKKNVQPILGVFLALSIAATLQAGSKFTDWSTPINLGPAVNTAYSDSAPAVSKDGLSLYLTSVRPGGLGEGDIWVDRAAGRSPES
jgi:hypothetical protein